MDSNTSYKRTPDSKQDAIKAPSLALPKGGGAIKGIGETARADAFSGAAAYSIGIPVAPARGFQPQLSVDYNSGNGNGVFGMGFALSLPKIARRTEKGIPRYDDSDIFMNDGFELVRKNKSLYASNGDWDVIEYLPRVLGSFSLIQYFVKKDKSASYWTITTNDNTISIYGQSDASRLCNPADNSQVFEWLIEQSTDASGNKIAYTYKPENADNVPDVPWEQNRSYNNKYIQSIQYGNYTDHAGTEQFAFQLIFDYGEYVLPEAGMAGNTVDPFKPVSKWSYRPDAFSSYKSGFEIRTCRLCRNVMLFHLFPDQLGDPCLVKSMRFDYQQAYGYGDANPGLAQLSMATAVGYRRSGNAATDGYNIQQTPPLTFIFSAFDRPAGPSYKKLKINDGDIPGYLNDTGFQPIDLNGEGIAGLLYHNNASIYFCSPEGEGQYDAPAFPRLLPAERDFANDGLSLTDLNGDGSLDLVVRNAIENGYYLKEAGTWKGYTPFSSMPTNISDPAVEMAGLSNNGKTDAIIVDDTAIIFYPSLGTGGYDQRSIVRKPLDFPSIKKDYLQEYVGFADMMGDGLSHRVKISDGSVECWPCMGYGLFGEKITMGNAPFFGSGFDIRRLFLTDIDGSGTMDIVYVQHDAITIYINQSGNYFSGPITVDLPAPYSAADNISFSDINGNGTNCLVYTKAGETLQHYYYDFTGETIIDGQPQKIMKPYLLIEIDNNRGAASQMQYCSSTKFYLEDKKAGDPWCTKLPFPVQLAETVTIIDKVSRSRYTSRYKFHDGYYDHIERQFIGFGFVEAWDAESYESARGSNDVPPAYTKTWYHTGASFHDPAVQANYKAHFYQGDAQAYDFPDTVFDTSIYTQDPDTLRQAYVALKGHVIRTEVYADDRALNPLLYQHPYAVEQSNAKVILCQEKNDQPYAVFLVVPRESISYHYERNPADPRVQQTFTLAVDAFGNITEDCTVFLQRRPDNSPGFVKYPEQYTVRGTLSLQAYVTAVDGFLFCHIPCEEQQLELAGIQPDTSWYFSFDGIKKQVDPIGLPDRSKIIPYGEPFTSGVQARQITWSTQYFWNWADPQQDLVLGIITSPALLHHAEEAVFTKKFTIDVFDNRLIDETAYTGNSYLSNIIYTHGGYFYDPANSYWWNKGLVQYYLPATYYLPCKTENSFAGGNTGNSAQDPSLMVSTSISYDDYFFFPVRITQEVGENSSNTTSAQIDYITGQPYQIVDINGNTTQVLYDPLGQVIVSSVFGLESGIQAGGMTLYPDGPDKAEYNDPGTASFKDVIAHPEKFLQGACTYFYYNLDAWAQSRQPVCAVGHTRNHYWHSPDMDDTYCQVGISYSDGLGRDIEKKLNVAPEKWQVTGRTVYNNKGKPCEQYLPYFTSFPEYEEQQDVPGPPPTTIHYDPLLRVVRVDTSKGFFSRETFTPWEVVKYDEDDTILDSNFYKNDYPGNLTPNEIDAIKKAVKFYNTPPITVLDNKGDMFLDIKNNADNLASYYATDISGRVVRSGDPRIYSANIINNASNYNFSYIYPMGGTAPVLVDSADAGTEKHLSNIFGSQLWTWSARSYCQLILYDRLQRRVGLQVKKISEPGPVSDYDDFNLVEVFVYGENYPSPGGYNVRGQVCKAYDLSGIVITASYTMDGHPLNTTRQMLADYKTAADWSGVPPIREETVYQAFATYNAVGQQLTQTSPDGSITSNTYNQSGRLKAVSVTFAGNGGVQSIIDDIDYDANGQRTALKNGNGITTRYTYEETTLRLTCIKSDRPTKGKNDTTVQDIQYYYDPAGNITRTYDNTIEIVFNKNQQVNPLSDYTYDAIYQLIMASGRQHTGITADTYKNNSSDSFKQCFFGPPPSSSDTGKLENYTAKYTYDGSGNLVQIKHTASSTTSWSRDLPVKDHSNRLKDMVYDASGNLRKLDVSNDVELSFNCCENLVRAGIIKRTNGQDDCDYYMYDSSDRRTRKVCERMAQGGTLTLVEDKIYVGNYEVKRNINVSGNGKRSVVYERQTLRVMDDAGCIAIIYYTALDKSHSGASTRQCRFQMDNNIGSACLEMDEQAQLISYEEYFPYGGTAIITGENQAEVKLKEYRYSGKERDDSTGLYYYGARYYVSWQGRWLNPDPAGTVDGMNLYAFVGGNPIAHKDENGLSKNNKRKRLEEPEGRSLRPRTAPPENNATPDTKRSSWRDMLGMRAKPNTDGSPTAGYVPTDRSFKSAVRLHWKGYRDTSGKTTGITLHTTKRSKEAWTTGHTGSRNRLSAALMKKQNFTPLNNGKVAWAGENSHLIAGSFWGPNDVLSAPPASVHQNTEWLAIETGLKYLIQNSTADVRFKATGYVYEQGQKKGWLKSARAKIFINGVKVFDHVTLGERGNIDDAEGKALQAIITGLSPASPADSLFGNSKGLSTNPPPSLADIRNNRTESIKSPMFTDATISGVAYRGQQAFNRMTKLYQ